LTAVQNSAVEALVAPLTVVPAVPAAPTQLVRNLLILSGGQMASWLLGIIWLVVVPRRLGPAAIGEFVIATSTAAVLGIFVNQGAGPLLTREVARDSSRASQLVGGAILMRLAWGIPACIGMFVYIHVVGFGPQREVLMWLATATVMAASISGVFSAVFGGMQRMEFVAFSSLVANSMVNLLGVGLVLLGGRVLGLMILALALGVLSVALNIYWSRGLFRIAWHGATQAAIYVFRTGVSFWIGSAFFLIYLWIDLILLSILAPARVVGWYGVPTELFGSVLVVASILCTAWFPRIAAAYSSGPDSLRRTARPAAEAAVVLSLPVAAGTALVAAPFVALFYGKEFAEAVPVLIILAICAVPTFFNMMADQILAAQGRQVSWVKVIAIATALNIGANLVLIPHFEARGNGAVGAALSLLGTEIFELAAALFLLPWLLSWPLLGRVSRATGATLLMASAVFAVSGAGLLVQVSVGVVAFSIFGLLLKVPTADELNLLRGFGARAYMRLRRPAAAL